MNDGSSGNGPQLRLGPNTGGIFSQGVRMLAPRPQQIFIGNAIASGTSLRPQHLTHQVGPTVMATAVRQQPGVLQVPQGMMVVRNQDGQLMLMQQQQQQQTVSASASLPGMSPVVRNIMPANNNVRLATNINSSSSYASQNNQMNNVLHHLAAGPAKSHGISAVGGGVSLHPQQPAMHRQQHVDSASSSSSATSNGFDQANKCRNFMSVLLRLSSQAGDGKKQQTVTNLIQNLIDNNITAFDFIAALKKELDSTGGQPSLLPFLNTTLPGLREFMRSGRVSIPGIRPPSATTQTRLTSSTVASSMVSQTFSSAASIPTTIVSPIISTPRSVATSRPSTPSSSITNARATLRDVDELNDVAAMGGVNLSEETRQLAAAAGSGHLLTQQRTCSDKLLLNSSVLRSRLVTRARANGLHDCSEEAVALCSHASEAYLRDVLERVAATADHRMRFLRLRSAAALKAAQSVLSSDAPCEVVKHLARRLVRVRESDARVQLLHKLSSSTSCCDDYQEDAEIDRAREIKDVEYNEAKRLQVNHTSLASIGPRKRLRFTQLTKAVGAAADDPRDSADCPTSENTSNMVSAAVSQPCPSKRVTLRDVSFVLERDNLLNRSSILSRIVNR